MHNCTLINSLQESQQLKMASSEQPTVQLSNMESVFGVPPMSIQPTPILQPVQRVSLTQPTPQQFAQPTPRVPVSQPIAQPTPRVPVPQPTPRVPVPQPIPQPTQRVPVPQPIPQPTPRVPVPQPITQPTPRVPVPQPITQPTPRVPTTRPMPKMLSASLFFQEPQKGIAKGHQRTSSAGVIHEPLEVSNYRSKFHELLKLEEIAHKQILEKRLVRSCTKCVVKDLIFFYVDVMGNTP